MTKDTEKALVVLYCEYKRRLRRGISKRDAIEFEDTKITHIDAFLDWNKSDITFALNQLHSYGYVKLNIWGDAQLTEDGIAYIENKPKEYFDAFVGIVKDILSLITAFR